MDGFELNKIAGAVLGSLLAVLGVNRITGYIYAPHEPESKAYVIEGVDEAHAATTTAAADAAPAVPLATLLAAATPEAGERVSKQCISCHSFEKGGPNKTGPNLWGIIGARFGHLDGYGYSKAFKDAHDAGRVWNFEELDQYLENPKKFMPGNKMSFAGLRRPEQRADMLIFLRQHMDSPAALPEPPPPAPAAGTTGDAAPAPGSAPAAAAGETPAAAPAQPASPGAAPPVAPSAPEGSPASPQGAHSPG